MYSASSLLQSLADMGIDPKGTLLVHSSMKAIGEVEGGADTVLDVLTAYMKDGLLVLPSHTWDSVNAEHPVYNVQESESCVGILTNLFRRRPGVIRSNHPTHSVAAIGAGAEAFITGEEHSDTPCPKSGCWGHLYDNRATILFLGCKLNRNTYIHGVEEWNNVPDRLSESTEELLIIDAYKKEHHIQMHRHHCSFSNDISENYIKMAPVFEALGALHSGTFGDAACAVCDAKAMADITSHMLKNYDMSLFADKNEIPLEWYPAF